MNAEQIHDILMKCPKLKHLKIAAVFKDELLHEVIKHLELNPKHHLKELDLAFFMK